jgi:CHASE2 domain-containing sensor protein
MLDADEIYLRYPKRPLTPTYRVSQLFQCTHRRTPGDETDVCDAWSFNQPAADASLAGHVVLLGGTYDPADLHSTPSGENTPGLMINALALQSEMDGARLVEFPRPFAIYGDVLLGFLALMVSTSLQKTSSKGFRASATVALEILLPVAASMVIFANGYLWLSWVVTLVAGFAWGKRAEGLLPDD